MNRIKGILFDKDGTLLDFNRTWLRPYRRAAEFLQSRFNVDADHLMACGGFIAETKTWRRDSPLASGHNKEIIACWEQTIGVKISADERRALVEIFTLPSSQYAPAVTDLAALLTTLHARDIKLGLATMDDEANAQQMLRDMNIASLFAFVCGADSGHGVKPQVGMVRAFCDACGLRPDETMMVGDSPRDLAMGKNAGVLMNVGVLSGAHVAEDLTPLADIILDNIAGLTTLFNET